MAGVGRREGGRGGCAVYAAELGRTFKGLSGKTSDSWLFGDMRVERGLFVTQKRPIQLDSSITRGM